MNGTDVGSPAHAGIDPTRVPPAAPVPRLPRSRGDRPHSTSPGAWQSPAPPLTRGSTLVLGVLPPPLAGSPAHAGIDPWVSGNRSREPGLPRSRGDRPPTRLGPLPSDQAPPLTRGSTRSLLFCLWTVIGSPAHAGIDPQASQSPHHHTGLPRSRGDRPSNPSAASDASRAPPLTRGSTRGACARLLGRRGSPAHAGIDPSLAR